VTASLVAFAPESGDHALDRVLRLVVDRVDSPRSKNVYAKALEHFITWYRLQGHDRLDRAAVQAYRTSLVDAGLAPSTVNQRLVAVRALAQEAADNGLLDPALASGIARLRGVKTAGVRLGNWLPQADAQRLLDAPDVCTVKGVRDRAILAVLLGCGLRRSEVAALEVRHVQQRDGRWVIVDLVGKGRRTRSVPMPSWGKAALDAWLDWDGIAEGRVFRSLRKGGRLDGASMTDQAIADVVRAYTAQVGTPVAAHDLRRTFAKLAMKGGARLEQIQLSLGHASLKTTERYLGVEQDLTDAPCDRLGLRLQAV
jgi:site-specific recombinase XerD